LFNLFAFIFADFIFRFGVEIKKVNSDRELSAYFVLHFWRKCSASVKSSTRKYRTTFKNVYLKPIIKHIITNQLSTCAAT